MFEDYYDRVHYLEGLSRPFEASKYPKVYLKRMQYFLDLVGNPEQGLKIIHVTGTAGKGSVSRLIQSMLVLSGHHVGLFTSPFVTTTIEKIQVGNKYISPQDFVEIVDYLKPFIEQSKSGPYGAPTYFEIILAIVFIHFQHEKCEWGVLEVGLGGRYDATNIVQDPLVTVITTIDYDHTSILGKTLGKIAYEKAGIIKKGSAFFTTEQRPKLLQFFKKVCSEVGASFHKVNAVKAGFENNNILLVKSIADYLQINPESVEAAIKSFRMPARFEIMQHEPLVVLDGAHSPLKIASVVRHIKQLKQENKKMAKIHAVIAFSVDKPVEKMLKILLQVVDSFSITEHYTTLRNAVSADVIATTLKKISPQTPFVVEKDPLAAYTNALSKLGQSDVLLVTGSFYLAGTIRQKFYSEESILKTRTSFPV